MGNLVHVCRRSTPASPGGYGTGTGAAGPHGDNSGYIRGGGIVGPHPARPSSQGRIGIHVEPSWHRRSEGLVSPPHILEQVEHENNQKRRQK